MLSRERPREALQLEGGCACEEGCQLRARRAGVLNLHGPTPRAHACASVVSASAIHNEKVSSHTIPPHIMGETSAYHRYAM